MSGVDARACLRGMRAGLVTPPPELLPVSHGVLVFLSVAMSTIERQCSRQAVLVFFHVGHLLTSRKLLWRTSASIVRVWGHG